MMKKTYIQLRNHTWGLTLCALLMACSGVGDVAGEKPATDIQTAEPQTLVFDVYTHRSTTRSGLTGSMDDMQLRKSAAEGGGFGVFAYHTDAKPYDMKTSQPNLMYNQGVFYQTDKWQYAPVKYWPNGYGHNAESDNVDKVTFFAYAPYVSVTPYSGELTDTSGEADKWGITGLSENTVMGDPRVQYAASFEADRQVDLLWAVCDTPHWPLTDGSVQRVNGNKTGLPWLNVSRPAQTDQQLKMQFRHATSQLAVTVDTYHDGSTPADMAEPDKTKIYVRSVTFTGFAMEGALSLNNTVPGEPLWLQYGCDCGDLVTGETVTVHDGRKDGKEAYASAPERLQGLNPSLVQSAAYDDPALTPGVTGTPQNLFRASSLNVIPTGDKVTVEIVYDVETQSPDLPGFLSDNKHHGSSVENRIRKTVSFGTATTFEAGHRYELALHLGMNSVKFDAQIADWLAEPSTVVNMPRIVNVGDLYFSDGTFGSAEDNPTKTPIGVVFSNAVSDADRAAGYSAYVVALRSVDADGRSVEDSGRFASNNIQFGSSNYIEAAALVDLDGRSHSQEIYSKMGQTVSGVSITSSVISAINAAVNYQSGRNGDTPPPNSSGWYLPSLGQMKLISDNWSKILSGCSSLPDNGGYSPGSSQSYTYFKGKRNFTNYLNWVTSTEASSTQSYKASFDKNTGFMTVRLDNKNSGSYRIRPVLAF